MPSAWQRGHAGDFGPDLKGLGPGGSILTGENVVAAVGLRAACLLLVDLGASLGVKLGGRAIVEPLLPQRLGRNRSLRPPRHGQASTTCPICYANQELGAEAAVLVGCCRPPSRYQDGKGMV